MCLFVCFFSSPSGDVTRIAGEDAGGEVSSFDGPFGLALDREGRVLVADSANHRVRALSLPSKCGV